ncbi:MAG: bifunctional diaminohydroxyphosphoribosylaminopyrimidine deaminase/5-amino-6-(5-phosphoribosylamino)uracil reductase RibD [Marinilabiliales bacterium]|nr:MAG: bifunctional diaminohydroxyphosphoribosylaminopyrimidine deaminase/5-amino-6-(5-phosphoribosylamino)uracil reductase RibD [Marinilabiliales bacterium]
MSRCLELAKNGYSHVEPNPYVGCVIVHDDKIIGEGWHRKFGEAHAEVNAIHSVEDKRLLSESTLYVNLEPCSHYGKTPPCADLIVQHKLARVFIGMQDPSPKVAGKGEAKLRNAGIEVISGVLEEESRFLNRRFVTFHTHNRPYVILKWAQTADKLIDIDRSDPDMVNADNWISGQELKVLVHKWRAQEMGILLGRNTLENDNPELTVREWEGKNPVRIILTNRELDENMYKVFNKEAETWVIQPFKEGKTDKATYIRLPELQNTARNILELLYQRFVFSLIVEGGRDTLELFIKEGLWDEARVIHGSKTFGKGLSAPELPDSRLIRTEKHGNDFLHIYMNENL